MTSFRNPADISTARWPQRLRSAANPALRHPALLCTLLAALWFSATAWLRPLAIPDEGRYVGVAWEMLRSGDWLVPTQNALPFFHKPPLFYWLTAASMQLLGPNVWAARLASVLAASIVTGVLFRFARRWRGERMAWRVAVVLVTLPLFYGSAQYANLDPLVAACISVAILLVAHTALTPSAGAQRRGALACAFAAAACGVLAKGLIGVALPVLVLLAWGVASGRLRQVVGLVFWWPGWLIFLAVAAPWFLAMQVRFADFSHYFFVVQHFQRFVATGFNNAQPFWFYPALLMVATLPWSPWALALCSKAFWRRPDPGDLRLLMILWVATVTVFFSLPRSKPIGYILPAVPPLAWLIADAAQHLRSRAGAAQATGRARLWWELRGATAVLAASVCVTALVAAHFYQPKSQAALASQLQAQRRPGEPVVFLGNYYFDIPFYARLADPVWIVDDWLPAEVARDSWRRELVDAERFQAPTGPHRLLRPGEVGDALRGRGPVWVVGPANAAVAGAWATSQPVVFQKSGTALWRVVASEPGNAPLR